MIARAVARYIKISPRKARLVADIVRGKGVEDSLGILMNTNKKASEILSEVIESAANNAKNKYPDKKYTLTDFYISKITVDGGPSLVRYRAASLGRASMIRRRSSHILVEVDMLSDKKTEVKDSSQKKQGAITKGKARLKTTVARQKNTKKTAHSAGSK